MQKDKNIELIYIVGTSYSGSTLLGFLLGAVKKVETLGELKMFNRNIHRICTCGKESSVCPFWQKYYQEEYIVFDRHAFLKQFWAAINIFMGKKIKQDYFKNTNDYQFLKAIYQDTQQKNKEVRYLLDTSKNLWRLSYLLQNKEINVHIIYTKRDLYGTVASYTKRYRFGFLQGFLSYKIKNLLVERFLKVNNLRHTIIHSKDIRFRPQETMEKLGSFLEVSYENFQNQIKNRIFHVRAGNPNTRKQFRDGFQGIRKKDDWRQHLSAFQIWVLSLFD